MGFIKKILIMCIGIVAMACGIAIFYSVNIGSDPISVFVDGQHRVLGLSYGTVNIIDSAVYLAIVIIFSRSLISFATFILTFAMGPLINMFVALFGRIISAEGSFTIQYVMTKGFLVTPPKGDYWIRLIMQVPAVSLIGFGLGLYLSANLGAAPLDAFMLLLKNKSGKSLKRVKIAMDFTATIIGFLFGGIVGAGTIIAVFATGPIASKTLKTMNRLMKT